MTSLGSGKTALGGSVVEHPQARRQSASILDIFRHLFDDHPGLSLYRFYAIHINYRELVRDFPSFGHRFREIDLLRCYGLWERF
jgi:hypothetical protein